MTAIFVLTIQENNLKNSLDDLATIADVEILVSAFYERAMMDEHIGLFFTEAVPLKLKEHLPKIVKFWSSILLDTNVYRDNPMLKHIALSQKMKIQESHMTRWLTLWKSTIDRLYEGPKADLAKSRSEQIGILMLRKIRMTEGF